MPRASAAGNHRNAVARAIGRMARDALPLVIPAKAGSGFRRDDEKVGISNPNAAASNRVPERRHSVQDRLLGMENGRTWTIA